MKARILILALPLFILISDLEAASFRPLSACWSSLKKYRRTRIAVTSAAGATLGYFAVEATLLTERNDLTLPLNETSPQRELRIGLIGDSLSLRFHLANPLAMIYRMRTERRGGWFLEGHPDSPYSFLERIGENRSVQGINYSTTAAYVPQSEYVQKPIAEYVGKVRSLSDQVDQIVSQRRLPDLLLIWIGHNNLDWMEGFEGDPDSSEKWIQATADHFIESYKAQMLRILERAGLEDQSRVLVVAGLINFRSFFEARDLAEQYRGHHPHSYPEFDSVYKMFRSMKPEYRTQMIHLSDLINQRLELMVGELRSQAGPKIKLVYSAAFSNVDIGHREMLHDSDAWHPSTRGHEVLAESLYRDLTDQGVFQFLNK